MDRRRTRRCGEEAGLQAQTDDELAETDSVQPGLARRGCRSSWPCWRETASVGARSLWNRPYRRISSVYVLGDSLSAANCVRERAGSVYLEAVAVVEEAHGSGKRRKASWLLLYVNELVRVGSRMRAGSLQLAERCIPESIRATDDGIRLLFCFVDGGGWKQTCPAGTSAPSSINSKLSVFLSFQSMLSPQKTSVQRTVLLLSLWQQS